MASRSVNATEFKARCLRLLDDVNQSGQPLVITKRGKPIARLVPFGSERRSMRGAWKGRVQIRGDIVHGDWTDEFEASR
jgi:prevent-host-death family protein